MEVLIYGYGNPGRNDDGLGVLAALEIEKWINSNNIENARVETNYQLNIEDADEILGNDIVVFVDATINEDVINYRLSEVQPEGKTEFTMHAVSPGFILSLSQTLSDKTPKVFLLEIKGYDWEFIEKTSLKAKENLKKAISFLKEIIEKPEQLIN